MTNDPTPPDPGTPHELDLYCMKATVAEVSDQMTDSQKWNTLTALRRKNPAHFFSTPKPDLEAAWNRAVAFVVKVFDLPPDESE